MRQRQTSFLCMGEERRWWEFHKVAGALQRLVT